MENAKEEGEKEEKEETVSPMRAYLKLWSFASPLDILLRGIGALAAAGSGTAEPLMAIIFGKLVDLFNGDLPISPEEFRSKVNENALYFVYLFVGKFVLVYIGATCFSITSSRMTAKIRLRYLRTVLHQPISYFDKTAPGTIATSLANDTNIVQVGLAEKLGIICQVISMILSSFVIAFTKNWKLTLVTATIVPYMVMSTMIFGALSTQTESKGNEILDTAAGVAEEALSSILNITAMGASEKMVRRFDEYLRKSSTFLKRIGPYMAGIYGNMFFAMNAGYALALFYGVKLVSKGEVTSGGTIVVVLFCMIMASSAMGFIAPLIPDFSKAAASAAQIIKMIGDPKEGKKLKPDSSGVKLDNLHGELELKDLSFTYPERPTVTVLDNINLRIPANKVTAIVGHSGSGKSTVVGLVEQWYGASKGSILIDGHDINNLDLQWWRSQIGLVQQEPMLFNDTIYQNVLNGLRGAQYNKLSDSNKRELVIEACKQANAHNFIELLPNGYDTPAGERAGLLSGGQKQRIAIARSIVSNPTILLLDEATSSLDSESERAVSIALEKASRGKTTIIIAHKLSTVVSADNIVVLSKGVVVEQGTHAELLALGGHYCRLLQAQGNSEESSGRETPIEEEQISKAVSRKPTHRSTKATLTDMAADIKSPLESEKISRRYSILYCMYKIYSEHPSLIWPSVLGFVAALVGGAAFPLQAVLFSRLVTVFEAQGHELERRGNFWALMFFVLGLTQIVAYFILFYFLGIVGARLGRIYRRQYLRSMLQQDIGFFQAGGNTSGGLTALLSADGYDLTMLFASNSGLILVFVTDLLSCCILAIAVYWKMALVAIFGCLPPLLASGFLRMRMDLTAQDRCAHSFLESARYSTEVVSAIRTVSSLTMEDKVESMYHQKLQAATTTSTRRMLFQMALYSLSDTLALAGNAMAFWYGGRLISYGELSTTKYFIIFSAVIFGGQSAGFMFGFTSSTNKAHAAMNRILFLTHSKPPINSSTGVDPKSSPVPADTPTVEFRDVNFRYPSRPTVPVLRGLSLSVARGSHVCVVGPSGCGKSTVVALLERFYDLQSTSGDDQYHNSGEICVYGRPIAEWDITKLRNMMGLVAQDTTLYQGTIRENVLIGIDESKLDSEEIESRIDTACKQANIRDFIVSLPQGYATDIGARGVALSGGQRQRLALARCLISNPDILLLDEATSALDPESEKAVREALAQTQKEREGLTVISVTHQVESMRDADWVFVVDKGTVVEEGRWDSLMSRKGRLWGMVVQGEVKGEA
ncbi:multidrug resistance protein [Lindgomyces ingoldianus]|uniref:Multidrug resistance protein n=1 Tax=Lindgomyces ingoldianus TaxID=673940 RepID=A0ACB6Q903_9PLEO|nr:multidrug resistance protein [Lindgomyces ingoldianus]KAF2463015.1 multidrug resistance protein [Lindgomyces ingoldianus]